MLLIETEFSKYEVDTVNKRIRRLSGLNPPTRNQGPDEVWKPYRTLSRIRGRYLIEWGEGQTLTSPVISEKHVALS